MAGTALIRPVVVWENNFNLAKLNAACDRQNVERVRRKMVMETEMEMEMETEMETEMVPWPDPMPAKRRNRMNALETAAWSKREREGEEK